MHKECNIISNFLKKKKKTTIQMDHTYTYKLLSITKLF